MEPLWFGGVCLRGFCFYPKELIPFCDIQFSNLIYMGPPSYSASKIRYLSTQNCTDLINCVASLWAVYHVYFLLLKWDHGIFFWNTELCLRGGVVVVRLMVSGWRLWLRNMGQAWCWCNQEVRQGQAIDCKDQGELDCFASPSKPTLGPGT